MSNFNRKQFDNFVSNTYQEEAVIIDETIVYEEFERLRDTLSIEEFKLIDNDNATILTNRIHSIEDSVSFLDSKFIYAEFDNIREELGISDFKKELGISA